MGFPGVGQGVPRIMLPISFWSYMSHFGSVMALMVVLFSLVMSTGHPEENSSNGYSYNYSTGTIWGIFCKSDHISFAVTAPTVLVSLLVGK